MAESPASFAPFKSLDVILSSIGDGVIAADSESRITYLNSVAERFQVFAALTHNWMERTKELGAMGRYV